MKKFYNEEKLKRLVSNKIVLYVATKNSSYIRVQQEIEFLQKYSSFLYIISSDSSNYFFRLVYVYFKILFFRKKVDVFFVGFAPQLVLPILNKAIKKQLVITDFFISLYDTFVNDRNILKKGSLFSKLLLKLDTLTIKYSDFIISDTQEHGKYFIEKLGASEEKVIVYYLQADRKYYSLKKKVEKPTLLKDKYIVLYFGSVLPLQGIEVVLDAIKKITEQNIYFTFIGPVEKKLKFTQSNVIFIDWLSQDKLAEYIAFSDLCLAGHFNNNIEKAKRVIPGKAYIYEAMNKKIVLGENSANKERYPKYYNNIIFVKMGSSEQLAKTILTEYKKWKISKHI